MGRDGDYVKVVIFLWIAIFSKSHEFNTDIVATNCTYKNQFPENFAPWTVLIRPSSRQTFLALLISDTTILATGQAFLGFKFKMHPFANYTIQIGAHSSDHKEFVQLGNVSYIKPHPNMPTSDKFWPSFRHDWVLIYLKEPIQFIKGIGPACLPNLSLIKNLTSSTDEFVAKLNDVRIHGTINLLTLETSYYVKLKSNYDCKNLWGRDPVTTGFGYRNRVCGYISRPSTNKSCIMRDSASTLEVDNEWYAIGFQNFHRDREARKVCNESYLVYISLLTPADLEWIHNDMKCGPLRFSCDNGTRCLDLKTVCDGKSHLCEDGSDQNSNYCNGLSPCESNQFACSRGLAAYCIPSINPKSGKVAKDCDDVKDCPNGEDEVDELCATKIPAIWIYIGVGVCASLASSLLIAILCWRRRNLRDLTEEELIDFFEGERHLQTDRQDEAGVNGLGTTMEIEPQDNDQAELIQPTLDSNGLIVDFCPENIRRRGFDHSQDFDVRNPSHCILGPQIGEGSFGIVKRGFVHGQPAAIKYPNVSVEVNTFKTLLLEIKILKFVHDAAGDTGHPNIVRFIGADTTRIRKRIVFVALEFCENGDIEEYLGKNRAHFQSDLNEPPISPVGREQTEFTRGYKYKHSDAPATPSCSESLRRLILWAQQIASGMKFLSRKVIHLDLAARNVFLDSNLVAKVGDFGLSRKVYGSIMYELKRDDPLPFQWLALEVLITNKCSHYSDIWSYGVTIWELFSLCDKPWEMVKSDHELVTKLSSGQRLCIPKFANMQIYQQMLACWKEQPEERPSFVELEAFFQNLLRQPQTQESATEDFI